MTRVMVAMTVMATAVMACAFQFAGDVTPSPLAPSVVPATEKMRIDTMHLTPTKITYVVAPEGMRVRDKPDAAGPGDSITLAVMRSGEVFQAETCKLVAGSWWAYGSYRDVKGWAISDFLEPNPCQ